MSRVQWEQPDYEHEWDVQCARCGSTLVWEDVPALYLDEDDEADPETYPLCLSTEEWCTANPLPGREHIDRSTPEWFTLDEARRPPEGGGEG